MHPEFCSGAPTISLRLRLTRPPGWADGGVYRASSDPAALLPQPADGARPASASDDPRQAAGLKTKLFHALGLQS